MSISIENNAQNCLNFNGEDSFDFTPHENEPGSATTKIGQFKTYIKLKPNTNLNIMAAEVNTTALCILQADARAQQTQLLESTPSCSVYLTAVNIILGMNPTTKKIEVFYQPMVLCLNGTTQINVGGTTCTFAQYNAHYGANFYFYTGTTFSLLPVAEQTLVTQSVKTYTASVKIVHYNGDPDPTYHKPDPAKDVVGDVNSVIYSFREIDKVITDNTTDKIRIWNEIMEVSSSLDGATRQVRRHSLILSGKNSNGVSTIQKDKYMSAEFASPLGTKAFVAAYANLAHLCPPNCNVVSYRRSCP